MKNLFEKFIKNRYYWTVEEQDVLIVLKAITNYHKKYVNRNIAIGRTLWNEECNQWFIHFDSNNDDWHIITAELNEKGFELVIRDEPNRVYLIKRTEL